MLSPQKHAAMRVRCAAANGVLVVTCFDTKQAQSCLYQYHYCYSVCRNEGATSLLP